MTSLGENIPRENNEHGLPRLKLMTVATLPDGSGRQIVVQLDAGNQRITVKKINSDGSAYAAAGEITLSLADTLGSDGNHHRIYIQETTVCVDDGAGNITQMKAMMPMSDPY
jgi:hypothetical protein